MEPEISLPYSQATAYTVHNLSFNLKSTVNETYTNLLITRVIAILRRKNKVKAVLTIYPNARIRRHRRIMEVQLHTF